MSASELHPEEGHATASQVVAGYLAAFSIFASLISLAWHPLRLVAPAMALALISAGMAGGCRARPSRSARSASSWG